MKPVSKMLVLGVALALSCSDAAPCADCPPIEGVWFLQYMVPDFPCDGGTPPAPPMTVQLSQEGSVLRGTIEGVTMSGNLYDTFDFTLNGQLPGGGLSVTMRGKYLPPTRPAAGDETLREGTLTRTTAGGCRDERRFTGARY